MPSRQTTHKLPRRGRLDIYLQQSPRRSSNLRPGPSVAAVPKTVFLPPCNNANKNNGAVRSQQRSGAVFLIENQQNSKNVQKNSLFSKKGLTDRGCGCIINCFIMGWKPPNTLIAYHKAAKNARYFLQKGLPIFTKKQEYQSATQVIPHVPRKGSGKITKE